VNNCRSTAHPWPLCFEPALFIRGHTAILLLTFIIDLQSLLFYGHNYMLQEETNGGERSWDALGSLAIFVSGGTAPSVSSRFRVGGRCFVAATASLSAQSLRQSRYGESPRGLTLASRPSCLTRTRSWGCWPDWKTRGRHRIPVRTVIAAVQVRGDHTKLDSGQSAVLPDAHAQLGLLAGLANTAGGKSRWAGQQCHFS